MFVSKRVSYSDCSKTVCNVFGGNLVVMSSSGIHGHIMYFINRRACILGQDFSC